MSMSSIVAPTMYRYDVGSVIMLPENLYKCWPAAMGDETGLTPTMLAFVNRLENVL